MTSVVDVELRLYSGSLGSKTTGHSLHRLETVLLLRDGDPARRIGVVRRLRAARGLLRRRHPDNHATAAPSGPPLTARVHDPGISPVVHS